MLFSGDAYVDHPSF
ncbi:hypothetical protein [uncultured Faecalibaculum sp.]